MLWDNLPVTVWKPLRPRSAEAFGPPRWPLQVPHNNRVPTPQHNRNAVQSRLQAKRSYSEVLAKINALNEVVPCITLDVSNNLWCAPERGA